MSNSVNILHFLSAFAALNGVMLSFFLCFFTKYKSISNYFLATLIMLLTVRAAVAVLVCYNYILDWFYLQLGITVCFFFGPFLHFYIVSLFQPKKILSRYWVYYTMTLFVITIILGIFFPSKNDNGLWKNYLIYIPYLLWLFYIIKSALIIKPFISKRLKNSDFQNWIKIIFYGNILLWIVHVTSRFTSYTVISLSIGILIYTLLFFLIFVTHKSNLFSLNRIKLQIASGKEIEVKLLVKLEQLMLEKELFKNKTLKVSDVAKELGISSHSLSQLINENLKKSFPYFIGEYRINYAKEMILKNDMLTLEAIGNESGFTSKSTFYSAFKKHLNTTPAKYKEEHNSDL
ncbi:helix-turn-helix domain-containing protein [Winogradskyella flava]|uniref:helix-turn-helix domain-containing protein n=1 Tax=Winogradskyella flava TaxID=1884876 RepID=UPI0024915659|nr:helix-turn-helix domain-containing protein [Winogradskyella flava]